MFITIYAAGMPFNGDTIPQGNSLGGSESAAYYMAKELAKIGHTVTVFTSHEQGGRWDNVQYEFHGEITEQAPLGMRFAFAMRAPQDVVIVQRHPKAFEIPPNSKINIWWLHDLALHRNSEACKDSLANTDKIFTVSEFHRQQVSEVYGIDKKSIIATQNGVDYDQITAAIKHRPERKKKHLCFASRPERGLENLVGADGCIMEDLPDYHLHVCGYDNTTREMAGFYEYLHERCEELPNVTYHGALGKDRLYKLLASCEAYIYPTMFEDTSNIMAIESAACGTPFVGMKISALPETCSGGFGVLLQPEMDKVSQSKFVSAIKSLCENEGIWNKKHQKAIENYQSWLSIAADWVSVFNNIFSRKTESMISSIKNFELNSDIIAMRKTLNDDQISDVLPDFKSDYRFLIENDFEKHYADYYQYEKDRGVEYGPEDMTGNRRFECIFDIVKNAKPETVLDYGCAHGHYTINMAKRMYSTTNFIGRDLAQSNVDTAIDWASNDYVDNVSFFHGDHTKEHGDYDFIIAAEVLEHVADPAEIVNSLIERLTPGGTMLISVPYGPWEAQGYEEHKGWRAHIHHLERQDLKEMFGHFDDYKCLALPHSGDLGHYVLTFTKPEDGRKCGEINYSRKLIQQAPTQTLSVCMIARNEENSIGRCLDSIIKHADEIIVGVDKTTTDNTIGVLEKYGVKYFDIDSPIDIGFDEARNLVIARAKCDWIMWIDGDETIENAHLLPHYLRQNPYEGYLIQQHHYSAEPATLLQTDLPCRIFRNNKNIRFYGHVHEHPSIKGNPDAGPGKVYVLPNIHIMHTGYATETKRRARFHRNFPLLQKDREKNPDRLLGKFLYVRDLAHFVRYDMEKTRGVVSEQAFSAAKEAIALWKDILENGQDHIRFVVDSLPYFSECVGIVTNGAGLNLKGSVNGTKVKGVFDNPDTFKKLMARLTETNIKIYSEKYF